MTMKKTFMMLTVLIFSQMALAEKMNIDLKESYIQWTGKKLTGQHTGKLYFKSGSIEVDKNQLKDGEFVVDLATLTVEDIQGDLATKLLEHMKGEDFFNVAKFPEAKLDITKVKKNNVSGNLAIKSKTNPIKFTYKKDADVYSGNLDFNRTKFDMVYGSGSFFKGLGDKVIHDKVELSFHIAPEKK